jgi:hypothetical protein
MTVYGLGGLSCMVTSCCRRAIASSSLLPVFHSLVQRRKLIGGRQKSKGGIVCSPC